MAEHETAADSSTHAWRDARRLFRFVTVYRSKLLAAFGAMMAATLLQLAFPYAVGRMVEGTYANLLGGSAGGTWFQNLGLVAGVMLVLVVLILVFSWLSLCLFAETGERGLADLRAAAYERLVQLPMRFFSERRTGELSSRMLADLGQIQELWIHDLRMLARYAMLAVGGVILMVVTSPRLAVCVLAAVPFVVLASFWIGRRIRTLSARTQDELARSSVVVEETLQGIEAVKAFHNEPLEIARYRGALDDFLPPAIRGARSRAFFICAILFVILGSLVFVMVYGSHGIEKGWMTPGTFTTFMFYLAFASSAGGTLAELYGKMQRVLGANTRLVEILEEETEDLEEGEAMVASRTLQGAVEFRNVSFAYPGRADVPVLEKVSFHAEPGENIALVGPSGAGKSTIVSLILRFFDPVFGEILVDGKEARGYPLGWLRSQMALVPQEVLLFGGSLRENIAYGDPGASMKEIEAAARTAHALEFIEALPRKFDTLAGDRGVQLSGGQRQRIALARAILKNPSVLILDEATSALDTESEELIREALADIMRERTSFVIAHRLSTVQCADRILVLREGAIVEAGSHEELLERGGFYGQLWEKGRERGTLA